MRACVYVDGFNFYYRKLKHSKTKWTNLMALSRKMLAPEDENVRIRYFTADVSPRAGDREAPVRQSTYFRALKTIPELQIHKGKMLSKIIHRPLVEDEDTYVFVYDTEEKGSDVNLASYLLMDAFCETYDVALVLSQDTDLLEPMRMITEELQKTLVLGWFEDTMPGKQHRRLSSRIVHITDSMLRGAQFPNPVVSKGGEKIFRPNDWS